MVDTGITSTAPVATAAPKKVWVKAKDEGKRPPLPVIAEEAKKDFAVKNWPLDSLEDVRSYALGEGNPVISKEVQKLTPEQRQLYIDTAQEVFLAHCNDRTKWRDDNPVRPAIVEMLDAAIVKFKDHRGWSAKPLNDIKTYVNKTGNRKIGGYLQKLDPAQKDAYLWTVTRVFAEACGLKLQAEQVEGPKEVVVKAEAKPTVKIDSVVPYWAQPGDQVQFVVTGEQLKQVTKVTAPELFKDLGQPEINDSGTAMTFATTLVPQSAQPGEYEFVLYGGEKGDQKLASFKVAVPEMSESGFSDSVKKLHINLDVNGGLAFGASGYTALGIYEEPITVNTFGINAGLAPQILGEKGLVKSDKQELAVSAAADFAYRGGSDDTTRSGARLGADYQLRIKPQFTPEVYGNLSYRKSNLKNPTPQYFNGTTLAENGGVAVNSLWAKGISTRVYFGGNLSQSSIDQNPLGFSYNDHAQYLEAGAKVRLGFFDRQTKAPNIELAGGLQYGHHEVPEREQLAGVWTDYGYSKETVKIISLGGKIDYNEKFRLGYDYTAKRYGGFWDAVDIHHLNAGTSAKGGDWDINIDLRPKAGSTVVGLSWQDPWLHALGLGAGYLKLDGNSGGFVGVQAKLFPIAEKIWGKSRPIYPAAVEVQTEPAAINYDLSPNPFEDAKPAPAPAKPAPAAATTSSTEDTLDGLDK